MVIVITPDLMSEYPSTLMSMYKLRHRVFSERLDWDVTSVPVGEHEFLEVDEYDNHMPTYIVSVDLAGEVRGCVRLLPTTGDYMLKSTFPALLGPHAPPQSPKVWEGSRIAVDPGYSARAPRLRHVSRALAELAAGIIEFGLWRGIDEIVWVTDVRAERILRRCGVRMERLCEPYELGTTQALGVRVGVTHEQLLEIRAASGLEEPALCAPVVT